jgi:hypothetical protein
MTVAPDYVREIFKGLEDGDGAAFFTHVADDVDWTVMGTHPLAGRYRSKADFIAGTFTKLGQVLPQGAQLHLGRSAFQRESGRRLVQTPAHELASSALSEQRPRPRAPEASWHCT